MGVYRIYGHAGWGSALIEAQFAWYGLAFESVDAGDLFEDEAALGKIKKLNPAGQVPVLVLPNGDVLTESAAITLWLSEEQGSDDLVPAPGAADRARFLRWLLFIVSNIYPAYTYMDDPARFVSVESARDGFAEAVCDRAKNLYLALNGQATGPWFLGDRLSAIDIYICAMTHWLPRRPWFEENTPALISIADAAKRVERFGDVWTRNYPDK
ncbi:MAG: glutathione S-transferase family protein [Hyphomicrobiaceae bacterium]|nr:glutathione S-transferase family protein [Hyphomicrobiaceae bacterium]